MSLGWSECGDAPHCHNIPTKAIAFQSVVHLHSVTSAAHPTEAAARQNAALALLRALDAHVHAQMFPPQSVHARPDHGPPPPACLLSAGGSEAPLTEVWAFPVQWMPAAHVAL